MEIIASWGVAMQNWVVLLEAGPESDQAETLELTALEEFLGLLADWAPSALYSPDRYAVQLTVRGDGPEPALIESIHRWRLAVAGAGLPPWPLVRAEVKTPAELEAENQAEAAPLLPATMSVTVDAEALEAAYQATRALLGATSDHDARVIIATLIYRLGGAVVPASRRPPDAVPLDLGFGEDDPMVAVAEPYSIARLRLEELLPYVIEDARGMVARLRARGLARRD